MKAVLLLAALAASLFANAFGGDEPGERCPFACAAVEQPVCGYLRGVHRTFNSACYMALENCIKRQSWTKVAECACVPPTKPPTRPRPGGYGPLAPGK